MTKTTHVSRRWTAAFAIAFLLPALIFFIMWSSIGLRFSGISDSDKMDTYISYFPGWLQNINTIHIISIVCCLAAIVLASRSFKKRLLSVRVLMLMTSVVAIFILLFDISIIIFFIIAVSRRIFFNNISFIIFYKSDGRYENIIFFAQHFFRFSVPVIKILMLSLIHISEPTRQA